MTEVPFNNLKRRYDTYKNVYDEAVLNVLQSGWYVLGKEGETFENLFSRYIHVPYVRGVGSGTDALMLALRALDIGTGDEVITSACTATPTVAAIVGVGAIPVFADIDESTYTIDSQSVRTVITNRTKAIMPIHLFGYPADMTSLQSIAQEYDLSLIEDCAQAHGAKVNGERVGTIGDIGAFSFYPTKNLGAFGDAGAVVTSSNDIAKRIQQLRNYGEVRKYENIESGFNSRLDEVQAAYLSVGIKFLDEWNARREEIARLYHDGLKNTPLVLPAVSEGGRERVWHLYVVQAEARDALAKHLQDRGVGTSVHYPMPVSAQAAYAHLGYTAQELPVTYGSMEKFLSLPLFPELTNEEVQYVIENIIDFYEK